MVVCTHLQVLKQLVQRFLCPLQYIRQWFKSNWMWHHSSLLVMESLYSCVQKAYADAVDFLLLIWRRSTVGQRFRGHCLVVCQTNISYSLDIHVIASNSWMMSIMYNHSFVCFEVHMKPINNGIYVHLYAHRNEEACWKHVVLSWNLEHLYRQHFRFHKHSYAISNVFFTCLGNLFSTSKVV